jgi:hypothetical protein
MASDRNEMLLKVHRAAGFSLMEMQGLLLLFTDRTRAHSKFVGSFPRVVVPGKEEGWPIRAIWAVCDFEIGSTPIDYDQVNISEPAIMDKIDHGVFTPEIEQLLPIAKGRGKK